MMQHKNIFEYLFLFMCGTCNAAPFLDGTASLVYQPVHQVFHAAGGAQSKVQGFARLGNGFTVLPDASCIFDSFVTVSGPVDLRETGTLILNSSLNLDSNVTLSGGGNIYGGGNALVLGGDLVISSTRIVHISGNTLINGQGNTLTIGDYAQLFVDNNVTLTLHNMVLKSGPKTAVFPPFRCAGQTSQLVLDDVAIEPQADIHFYQGKLSIINDVIFSGTSALVYNSPQSSIIKSGATLLFDYGTTFSYVPATTSKDLIQLQDASAKVILDGGSLKCTDTGLRLTVGSLLCDNKVSFDSVSSLYLSTLTTGSGWRYTGTESPGFIPCAWRPDGRYLAIGADYSPGYVKILKFDGTNFSLVTIVHYGNRIFCMSWSPDGRYLAVGGGNGDATVKVFSFDGTNLTLAASKFYGIYIWGYAWSTDGRYLAAVGTGATDADFGAGSTDEIKVYTFNGQTLQPQTSMPYGNWVLTVGWHPSNDYLAVGGFPVGNSGKFGDGNNDELRIYRFDQTMTLTPLVHKPYSTVATTNGYIKTLHWSPDGKFLALGGDNPGIADSPIVASYDVRVYGFNGVALTPITSRKYGTSLSVNWHPDGKTISLCGGSPTSGSGSGFDDTNILRTYRFDGAVLQPAASLGTPSSGFAYSCPWHPSGNYLGVGGTIGDGVTFYVINTTYSPTLNTQPLRNSLVFGSSTNFVRSAWYGDPADSTRRIDVTAYVNNNIIQNSGALSIAANNGIGGDPAPGAAKSLSITFVGGSTVSCAENSSISLSAAQVTALTGSLNLNVKVLSGGKVTLRGKVLDDAT